MAEHNDLGQQGEELARGFLREKGFEIFETNWRFGKDEIDIIAKKDDELVIVEVKTRSTNYFGEPEVFVNKNKQGFLIRAAQAYIVNNNLDVETRFDIVAVLVSGGKHKIHHIENAFYPTIGR